MDNTKNDKYTMNNTMNDKYTMNIHAILGMYASLFPMILIIITMLTIANYY